MNTKFATTSGLAGALAIAAIAPKTVLAQDGQATPGFNTKIPEKIMTPDKVETSIGTLSFFDGMPDKATVDKAYDNLDSLKEGLQHNSRQQL